MEHILDNYPELVSQISHHPAPQDTLKSAPSPAAKNSVLDALKAVKERWALKAQTGTAIPAAEEDMAAKGHEKK